MPKKAPKVAVVLIGTNDLYYVSGCLADPAAELADQAGPIVERWVRSRRAHLICSATIHSTLLQYSPGWKQNQHAPSGYCRTAEEKNTWSGCGNLNVLLFRFQDVIALMRSKMPQTHIILQGLYPRGADFASNALVWPNSYTKALDIINQRYEVYSYCTPSQMLRPLPGTCLYGGSCTMDTYEPTRPVCTYLQS
jgi:hypothetical protein